MGTPALPPTPALPRTSVTTPTPAPQKFDLCFPVEVEDGRQLTIAWNKSDDVLQGVQNFACKHGIMPEELPIIQAFVEQANALHGEDAQTESEQDGEKQTAVEQPDKLDADVEMKQDATPNALHGEDAGTE